MFQEVLDIPKYTNPERVRMMHDGFARWRTNLMVSIQKGEKMCCLISRGTNTNPTSILIPTKPSAEKTKFVDTGKCVDGDGYLTTG
jgi:hypothetical protein